MRCWRFLGRPLRLNSAAGPAALLALLVPQLAERAQATVNWP
jgi:ABC-type enterobactin transport system permease subunit